MTTSLASLFRPAGVDASRDAIVVRDVRCTWGALGELIAAANESLAEFRGRRVGLFHRGDGPSWAALTALDALGAETFLLNASLAAEEAATLAEDFQFAATLDSVEGKTVIPWRRADLGPRPAAGESHVTILTSGTTGKPKAARHTWATLCRPVRAAAPAAWLQSYRPHLYAGLQVAMQCFAGGGTLVNPGAEASPEQIVDAMVRHGVAFVSATPSYWRRLLIFGDQRALGSVPLKQITLGGELVDQQVLDMLRATFPAARLVHIYATTELGRCFSVTDGQAGFPARFVGPASPDGVELRVVEGELEVRSANAMQGYDSGHGDAAPQAQWFATGDLVRLEGDRYYFVGRRSDIINVGGNKVSPVEVEAVLTSVPGVAAARVFAKKSSVAGQLVVAQIVVDRAYDAAAVKAAVVAAGVERLLAHQRPRMIEVVNEIELSDAGKVVRK